MKLPLVISMFVSRNAGDSGRPGVFSRHVQLVGLRKEHVDEKADVPNAALFENERGSVNLHFNETAPEVSALLPVGKKIKVTVELVDE